MSNQVRFEKFTEVVHTSQRLESDVIGDERYDIMRVTIRTINPDQTGLMTHSEVMRKDLETFWLGCSAVARTWMGRPRASAKFADRDLTKVSVTMWIP